ncbi:hypothetical protein V6N11_080687 [Hibiscus sabdariffa]|uniref:Uncharacterized protein n=1 Tax=Hibiscus sabdariffa TaxID=183260 RepID=A0ABR2QHL6_9ROSI
MASIRRKRITLPRTTRDSETNGCSTSSVVDKGHFVVYSVDQKRFVLPLEYLKNSIIMELFNLAEEEFGLPSNGILFMPCDANFMEYVIALIKKKPSEELEKALIMSVTEVGEDSCLWKEKNYFTKEYVMNRIFQELFKMSEEEFGLSNDGPITLSGNSVIMSYIVLLVQRGLAKDLEKVVLSSIIGHGCLSYPSIFHEGHAEKQSLVCGF